MKKSELLLKLQEVADDAEINEIIQGIEGLTKTFDIKSIGLDDFKSVLESNDIAKSYFQSSLDSGIGKGVSAFKEKTLPSIIEEELKKHSNKDKTPEQIKLEELQSQLDNMQKEKTRAELSSKYTKVLSEKGLPVDLVDYIYGDGNEETINSNIEKFGTMFSTITDTKVNEKLMNNSYVPPKDGTTTVLSGVEQAFYSRNPNLAQ